MLGNRPRRALRPDAQAFDEVRIRTVPRYKTSGLSGDEWRISAQVDFIRKGKVICGFFSNNVANACYLVGARHIEACDNAKGYFAGEGTTCDQEGCAAEATVIYRLKAEYCREGHRSEVESDRPVIRMFCEEHKSRGDCGLEDADTNYEPV